MVADISKILLVEDDSLQAQWLRHMLETFGYTVHWVTDGVQAMEALQGDRFSIVMTDLMMPRMNGIELCRAIRKHPFDHYIYIVIVTGKDEKSDFIAGIEAGADDYIVKPVEQSELFTRLKTTKRILNMESTLRKQYEEIALLSATDPLTGTYNRRYFTEHLHEEILRSARYSRDLSVILCDIDRFKNVNDSYGHLVGDRVLQEFAACLVRGVRQGVDFVARFGGEEFIIVLPETDSSRVQACAQRLRQEVAQLRFADEKGIFGITASFGAVTVSGTHCSAGQTVDSLLKAADDNLYQAKQQGRNRTVFSQLSN
jgi:diguanylate cyclase (GGDEF)-like protein